jgi:hypothetical protein
MWKVKLSLCFNWAPRHEGDLVEWRYSSIHSLTAALVGDEWSASRPGRFTTRERTPGTHWTGGCVGPRALLNAAVERKIPSPRRESNPRTPIVQAIAQRYTDWAITALFFYVVLSNIDKGLVMNWFTEQVLPKCLKGFTVSEVNSDSEQARGPNPWNEHTNKQTNNSWRDLMEFYTWISYRNVWTLRQIVLLYSGFSPMLWCSSSTNAYICSFWH